MGGTAKGKEALGIGIGIKVQLLNLADARGLQPRGDIAGKVELEVVRRAG